MEPALEIRTRQSEDILVVEMTGRLDSSTAGAAYDRLTGIAKGDAKRILLDLGGLDYVSSAGLRAMLTMAKLAQTARGEVRICNARAVVKEALETSGFNSLIRMFEDERSAVAGWA